MKCQREPNTNLLRESFRDILEEFLTNSLVCVTIATQVATLRIHVLKDIGMILVTKSIVPERGRTRKLFKFKSGSSVFCLQRALLSKESGFEYYTGWDLFSLSQLT
jgi:hypothetical protein